MATTATTTTTRVEIVRRGTLARALEPMAAAPDLSRVAVREAKRAWAEHRCAVHGFALLSPALLSPPSANLKLEKSAAYGLALAPARTSGYNACSNSTPVCRAGCVAFGGNGRYPRTVLARIARTTFAAAYPRLFATLIGAEISALPAGSFIRLNTFSDVPWEDVAPWLFELRDDLTYYDYTKLWHRSGYAGRSSYHLGLSASERTSDADIVAATSAGRGVAVVFDVPRGKALPDTYLGRPVVDADKSDRWIVDHDGRGVIGGLRVKGLMRGNGGAMVRSAGAFPDRKGVRDVLPIIGASR